MFESKERLMKSERLGKMSYWKTSFTTSFPLFTTIGLTLEVALDRNSVITRTALAVMCTGVLRLWALVDV